MKYRKKKITSLSWGIMFALRNFDCKALIIGSLAELSATPDSGTVMTPVVHT